MLKNGYDKWDVYIMQLAFVIEDLGNAGAALTSSIGGR
jgi:hypothetical protein